MRGIFLFFFAFFNLEIFQKTKKYFLKIAIVTTNVTLSTGKSLVFLFYFPFVFFFNYSFSNPNVAQNTLGQRVRGG